VNVLTNAQQAVRVSPRRASPDITLSLHTEPAGRARITIADNGTGIPPEQQGRVFEPFFTTRRGGSGLGLAIARNVVEGLGGTIALSSAVERGTTVTIELPLAVPLHEASA
jgi:two-component system NtrC family sensor kinase